MTTPELGRLERVELRNAWANEALHFTPWLAQPENLALLGETIGIDLELEATEKSVGPFSADILCKNTTTDKWVLIENQIEKTDHRHLGQLITYAAGLQAETIVWIASSFTSEHRAALDMLNQVTDDSFNCFGLEVELWRIGDSLMAPKFNVVSKPNDWTKTVAEGARTVERENLTDAKLLQLRFWTYFADYVQSQQTPIRTIKPRPQNWMIISIGKGGINLVAVASTWDSEAASYESNELRVEFEIKKNPDEYFAMFEAEKETIERELGYPLVWQNAPNKISKRMYVKKSVNLSDEADWDRQCAWLLRHLEDFHRVFGPRVRNL